MGRQRTGRIPSRTLERVATILRALSHPHRLRIVELLQQQKPVSVGELAKAVGLPPAAVSQHLAHMRAHGIVSCRREGRQVYYQVTNRNAANLIECIRLYGAGH